MPTVISIAADSNKFSTNEKLIDALPGMMLVEAPLTPFITLFTKMAANSAKDTTKRWFNDEAHPLKVVHTGAKESTAPAAGAGTLTIAAYTYLRKDDMLSTADPLSMENILVTATPTSSTVSVYRGKGTGTVALDSNQTLIKIAPSKVEAANYTNSIAVVNTEDYNYVQEFDATCEISTLANAVSTHAGGPGSTFSKEFQKMMTRIKKEMELNVILSERSKVMLSGESYYRTNMGGVLEYLKDGTNYWEVPSGLFSEAGFDAYLEEFMNNNPDVSSITGFFAPKLISAINQWGKGRLVTSPMATKYGMGIDLYKNGAIELNLLKCPLWATMPGLSGMGALLDTSIMELNYLIHPEINEDAEPSKIPNSKTGKFYTAFTMSIPSEFRHGLIVGVKG
jgi:hypothetical protein